jgi:hypothetical protein
MLHSPGPIRRTRQAEGDAITPCRVKEEVERAGSGHDQEHRSGAGPSRPTLILEAIRLLVGS